MTIEKRLEALEQAVRDGASRVRRLRMLATGLSVALLAMIGVAANEPSHPVPEVVRARTFEVVGDRGEVLARLGQLNGDGGFALYGPNGKLHFVVGMTANGTGVSMLNRDQQMVRLTSMSDLADSKAATDANLIEYPSRDPIED